MSVFWPIFQVCIVILETFIRLKVTSPRRHSRKIGYACGIAAQFFWLAIFLRYHQYYLLPLLALDGSIWARGLIMADRYHKLKHLEPEYII